MYWPGLYQDIDNMFFPCAICEKCRSANIKEPLIPYSVPKYTFENIGIDILQFAGKNYLVLVDYFSKWIELVKIISKVK